MDKLDTYLAFAEHLADLARPILIAAYHAGQDHEMKGDGSPVTLIDRQIEQLLRAEIAAAFPDHGILGEEFGVAGLDRDLVWVLDPIDGTRAFATGLPNFGCLIALCDHGRPVLGVIEIPVAGLRAVGAAGRPTLCNGMPVRVRDCGSLKNAVLSDWTNNTSRPDEPGLARLKAKVNWSLRDGGCVSYLSLARGYFDLCVDGNLDAYDFCAFVPVVEGAGGIITDWNGAPLTLASGPLIIAAGSATCHREALAVLNADTLEATISRKMADV